MKAQTLLVGLGIIGALVYTSVGAQLVQHGPTIIHPGDPDAYIMVDGHPVQLEYLACIGEAGVVWYEDGSPRYCTRIGQPGK